MDTRTGRLMDAEEVAKLPAHIRDAFVPVRRDLTAKEQFNKQIKMYAPCGCGSGKKFRFCCYRPNR